MGNIIKFPVQDLESEAQEREALKLIKISDEIDEIILKHLGEDDTDGRDLAGILAHRLGTLMRTMDEKDRLFDVCKKVLKKQAAID